MDLGTAVDGREVARFGWLLSRHRVLPTGGVLEPEAGCRSGAKVIAPRSTSLEPLSAMRCRVAG